jgi:hypothetical protein
MAEARDDERHEKPEILEITADGAEDEPINDPLTQTDVEALELPSNPDRPLISHSRQPLPSSHSQLITTAIRRA